MDFANLSLAGRIPLFHCDNGGDEFFLRSLWFRPMTVQR
jgi:hypothetical protein